MANMRHSLEVLTFMRQNRRTRQAIEQQTAVLAVDQFQQGWQQGWREGWRAGYEAAKKEAQP
jgi:hypothetical protein